MINIMIYIIYKHTRRLGLYMCKPMNTPNQICHEYYTLLILLFSIVYNFHYIQQFQIMKIYTVFSFYLLSTLKIMYEYCSQIRNKDDYTLFICDTTLMMMFALRIKVIHGILCEHPPGVSVLFLFV